MMWKAIGKRCTGEAHKLAATDCEDALQYEVVEDIKDREVLIACLSDGAGGARYGGMAADFTVSKVFEGLKILALSGYPVSEQQIRNIVEDVYQELVLIATLSAAELNEYSCTLLGCYVAHECALFFRIGDGAIVFLTDENSYEAVWWPDNEEYQNMTSFLVDDEQLNKLSIEVMEGRVREVALFTDGLQRLALNYDSHSVHQPFFNDLFRPLRKADSTAKLEILNQKLVEFLDRPAVNARTDDDKTLFLASCLFPET